LNCCLSTMANWKTTKAEITYFLGTNVGKQMNLKSARGAIVFTPSDYCPFTEECLSFQRHARGKNGRKGVQSHLRKVHADVVYYLVPCSLRDLVKYSKDHPDAVKNVIDGMRSVRLRFCPVVSSPAEATMMEKDLRKLFAEKRHKDHCATFLDPAISLKSRNMNYDEGILEALTDTWARSPLADLGISAKADATRARLHAISILETACHGEKSFDTIACEVPALRSS